MLLAVIAIDLGTSAQDVFVTTVPGIPFGGVVNVERVLIQPDGSIVKLRTTRDIGRDSRGRFYNALRALVAVFGYQRTPAPTQPSVRPGDTDLCYARRARTFWTMTVNHPPATVLATLLDASPTGDNLPRTSSRRKKTWAFMTSRDCPRMGFGRLRRSKLRLAVTEGKWSLRMSTGTQMICALT